MCPADELMTTSTELSAIVPAIWSRRYYDVLLAELPFNSLMSTDYQGDIQDLGNTVNISQFPEFDEGEDLSEDASSTARSITVSQLQLVINKRVVKDFIVTKTAILQSLPAMDKLRELSVYAILKHIQATIIATIVPGASTSKSFTSSTTLALADMLKIKVAADGANWPGQNRHMVVGASNLNDLFNITGFMSSDFALSGGVGGLQSGQTPPQLLGFTPHWTTVISVVAYFFHPSFMAMASQQGLQVREYDLGVSGTRATRVNLDTLYGIKQLDAARVATLS